MSKIIIERAHRRGLEAARAEAEVLAEDLSEKFGMKYRWSGETLEFKGSGAKGEMRCAEGNCARNQIGWAFRLTREGSFVCIEEGVQRTEAGFTQPT